MSEVIPLHPINVSARDIDPALTAGELAVREIFYRAGYADGQASTRETSLASDDLPRPRHLRPV